MSSGPAPTVRSKLTSLPLPALWLIIIAQTAVHLALVRTGGWISDTRLLQSWAKTLTLHPASTFYASQKRADHLPGDLWILHLEAWAYRLVSGHPPSNTGFLIALKLGPALADIGLALVVYLIAREVSGARLARGAALLFALNPAPYFISMVWGVADSVSMLFAATAIWLTLRRSFWAAAPVLTYACLIKPQLGILAPLLLIFFLHDAAHQPGPRRALRLAGTLALGGGASIAVLLATLLPFNVGVPFVTERWSLFERISFAANLYSSSTMNALNLWAFIAAERIHFPTGDAPTDSTVGLFGLSYQAWAILLTAVVCLILTIPLIRKGGKFRLVQTCGTVTFAFFMLQTRMHERYFFPAIVLMALTAALRPRLLAIYVLMSGVYFANIWWVYHWLANKGGRPGGIGGVIRDTGRQVGLGKPGSTVSESISSNLVRALSAAQLAVLAFFVLCAVLDARVAAKSAVQTEVETTDEPEIVALAT